jgi:hypothetical protein
MTSIEWLEEQLNPDMKTMQGNIIQDLLEQAKEMHKQEIIDAWNGGDYAYFYSKETGRDFADGNDYYAETFVSKGSDVDKLGNEDVPKLGYDAQLPQQEISDEEIEKAAAHHEPIVTRRAWVSACKWYREQLKQRQ